MLSYFDVQNLKEHSQHFKWALDEETKNHISNDIISSLAEYIKIRSNSFEKEFITVLFSGLYSILSNTIYIVLSDTTKSNYQQYIEKFNRGINPTVGMNRTLKQFIKKYMRYTFPQHKLRRISINPNPTALRFLELNDIDTQYIYHHSFYTFQQNSLTIKDQRLIKNLQSFSTEKILTYINPNRKVIECTMYLIYNFASYYLIQFKAALKSTLFKKVDHIYTGTQGKLATRIISMAALVNNTQVSAFPHTGGFMLCMNPIRPVVECSTCSDYYCYDVSHKDTIISQSSKNNIPITTSFHILPNKPRSNIVEAGAIKHVTYPMLTLNFDNEIHNRLITPTSLYTCLNYKIIDSILEMNIKLTLKVHRKDLSNPILQHHLTLLRAEFGNTFEIEDSPLDKLINSNYQTDAWICDNIDSGTIIEVLKSDKPVIFFGWHVDNQLSQSIFRKRAKLIPLKFQENIPTFDKNDLFNYLCKNKHTLDFSGSERYLNYNFKY